MRFLADENIPGDAVAEIEAAGHDIVWVRTVAPGSKDEDVLAWAVREERIILTFDKDFGELAWRAGLPVSSGIVLIRLPMPRAAEAGTAALDAQFVRIAVLLGLGLFARPRSVSLRRPLPSVRPNVATTADAVLVARREASDGLRPVTMPTGYRLYSRLAQRTLGSSSIGASAPVR
jgi:predicted nuclease of predicted toxin-antitoxin system